MHVKFTIITFYFAYLASCFGYGRSNILNFSQVNDVSFEWLDVAGIAHNQDILLQFLAYGHRFCLYLQENTILLKDVDIQDIHKPFKGIVVKVDEMAKCPTHRLTSNGWARLVLSLEKYSKSSNEIRISEFQGDFACNGEMFYIETKDSLISHQHRFKGLSGQRNVIIYRDNDIARQKPFDFIKRSDLSSGKASCDFDKISWNIDGSADNTMLQRMDNDSVQNEFLYNQLPSDTPESVQKSSSSYTCSTEMRILPIKVVVDCLYISKAGSIENAKKRLLAKINAASALYEKLNVYLGVLSWKFMPQCNSTAFNKNFGASYSMIERLNDFAKWLYQRDDQVTWLLMTGANTATNLGLSYLGTLCSSVKKETPSQYIGPVISVVQDALESTVIAHELGHLFGLKHDCNNVQCDNCATPDCRHQSCTPCSPKCDCGENYLMSAFANQSQVEFSPQSLAIFCKNLKKLGSCLKDHTEKFFQGTNFWYEVQTVSLDKSLYNCTDFIQEGTGDYAALCNSKGSNGESNPTILQIDARSGAKISDKKFDTYGRSSVATCIASGLPRNPYFVGYSISEDGKLVPFAKTAMHDTHFFYLDYSGIIAGCAMSLNGSNLFSVGRKFTNRGSLAVLNIYSVIEGGRSLDLVVTKEFGESNSFEDKINAITFNPNFPSNSSSNFMLVMAGQVSGKATIWFVDENYSIISSDTLDEPSEFNAVLIESSTSIVYAAGKLKGSFYRKESKDFDLFVLSYDGDSGRRLSHNYLAGSSKEDNILSLDFDDENRYLLAGGYLGGSDTVKLSNSNSESVGAFVGSIDFSLKSPYKIILGKLPEDSVKSFKFDKSSGKIIGIASFDGSPHTFIVSSRAAGLEGWKIALISTSGVVALGLASLSVYKLRKRSKTPSSKKTNQDDSYEMSQKSDSGARNRGDLQRDSVVEHITKSINEMRNSVHLHEYPNLGHEKNSVNGSVSISAENEDEVGQSSGNYDISPEVSPRVTSRPPIPTTRPLAPNRPRPAIPKKEVNFGIVKSSFRSEDESSFVHPGDKVYLIRELENDTTLVKSTEGKEFKIANYWIEKMI